MIPGFEIKHWPGEIIDNSPLKVCRSLQENRLKVINNKICHGWQLQIKNHELFPDLIITYDAKLDNCLKFEKCWYVFP